MREVIKEQKKDRNKREREGKRRRRRSRKCEHRAEKVTEVGGE